MKKIILPVLLVVLMLFVGCDLNLGSSKVEENSDTIYSYKFPGSTETYSWRGKERNWTVAQSTAEGTEKIISDNRIDTEGYMLNLSWIEQTAAIPSSITDRKNDVKQLYDTLLKQLDTQLHGISYSIISQEYNEKGLLIRYSYTYSGITIRGFMSAKIIDDHHITTMSSEYLLGCQKYPEAILTSVKPF